MNDQELKDSSKQTSERAFTKPTRVARPQIAYFDDRDLAWRYIWWRTILISIVIALTVTVILLITSIRMETIINATIMAIALTVIVNMLDYIRIMRD